MDLKQTSPNCLKICQACFEVDKINVLWCSKCGQPYELTISAKNKSKEEEKRKDEELVTPNLTDLDLNGDENFGAEESNFEEKLDDDIKYEIENEPFQQIEESEIRIPERYESFDYSDGNALSLLSMPEEIILHIFSYLDQCSLYQCLKLSRHCHIVGCDASLWDTVTVKNIVVTASIIHNVSMKSPSFLSISQCCFDSITKDDLEFLFSSCGPLLQSLNLSKNVRLGALMNFAFLPQLKESCANICSLDLSWTGINDAAIIPVFEYLSNLVQVSLNGCMNLLGASLKKLVKKHKQKLLKLHLFKCVNLSPVSSYSVMKCENLEDLNIGGYSGLLASGFWSVFLRHLGKSLPKLSSLNIYGYQRSGMALEEMIRNCTSLSRLVIGGSTSLNIDVLVVLSKSELPITHLDVTGVSNLRKYAWGIIGYGYDLVFLDLSFTNVSHLERIARNCKETLETLRLNYCRLITYEEVECLLSICCHLKHLYLYGCDNVHNIETIARKYPELDLHY